MLGIANAVQLAMVVIKNGLSVRATEALVSKNVRPKLKAPKGQAFQTMDIRAVESHLGDLLGLKFELHKKVRQALVQ